MDTQTLKILPKLLSIQLNEPSDYQNLSEIIRTDINFDKMLVYSLNSNVAELITDKSSTQFNLSEFAYNEIYSAEKISSATIDFIAKQCGFDNNIVIEKLKYNTIVFGFIVFSQVQKISEKTYLSIKAYADVISHLIRTSELNQLFNEQTIELQTAISRINKAYKTIERQNKKILEADKVKSEFLANVSHELRTPLNAIIGFSEILQTKIYGELNSQQETYIKDIHSSGIHLLGMINEILDISKIESNAMKLIKSNVDVFLLISEVCNIIKPLADKKHISVMKNISENIFLMADYQKLQQVLFNLLSNAIKFTPDKGKIEIFAEKIDNNLVLKVKDNGIGIAQKNQKKIFKKFMQVEDAYTKKESSTGLGLTITKKIVEMHKGAITIESELNKGACFIVTLPL